MPGAEEAQSVLSLPKGGGALKGMGETFAPDLHTGTGNFTVPIALLPGRNGFQPQLSLTYSTGHGNGLFGMGWSLSVPGIARKTAKGIPRYRDMAASLVERDTFILSGSEDLVFIGRVNDEAGVAVDQYRPRTEDFSPRSSAIGMPHKAATTGAFARRMDLSAFTAQIPRRPRIHITQSRLRAIRR